MLNFLRHQPQVGVIPSSSRHRAVQPFSWSAPCKVMAWAQPLPMAWTKRVAMAGGTTLSALPLMFFARVSVTVAFPCQHPPPWPRSFASGLRARIGTGDGRASHIRTQRISVQPPAILSVPRSRFRRQNIWLCQSKLLKPPHPVTTGPPSAGLYLEPRQWAAIHCSSSASPMVLAATSSMTRVASASVESR